MVRGEVALERRGFLRGVGIAGATLVSATGLVGAAHGADPSITFPDGRALVLPEPKGPFTAAVRTREVFMPEGGWVVISNAEGPVIGHSFNRLPAGHFESLLVAVEAQEPGCYSLDATLFRGARGDAFPDEPDDVDPYDAKDRAVIAFGKQPDCDSAP